MNSSIIDVLLGSFINYRRLTLITEEETRSPLHTQTTLSQTIILPICSSKGPFIFPKNHSFYPYFPGGSDSKASAYNMGDLGLIPGLGRSPGEGNGNPLQYSCLENPMTRKNQVGYSPWGCKELDMTERDLAEERVDA